jgi:osmotically inducible protein OsmC
MQLSAFIEKKVFPESIETKCEINLVDGVIVGSHIAKIEGIYASRTSD